MQQFDSLVIRLTRTLPGGGLDLNKNGLLSPVHPDLASDDRPPVAAQPAAIYSDFLGAALERSLQRPVVCVT